MACSFNTCSSCEEQPSLAGGHKSDAMFQYMLLLRGATRVFQRLVRHKSFNTCSSCEEQLFISVWDTRPPCFNTCSSCEEQRNRHHMAGNSRCFNTCSSCEEQPSSAAHKHVHLFVSIHAPLARSNTNDGSSPLLAPCFNTCSSCEEQLRRKGSSTNRVLFQYMLLLRGATVWHWQ